MLAARRSLRRKDTLLYAPMANLGNVMLDRDAVYINLPPKGVIFSSIDEVTGSAIGTIESNGGKLDSTTSTYRSVSDSNDYLWLLFVAGMVVCHFSQCWSVACTQFTNPRRGQFAETHMPCLRRLFC